MGIFKNDDQKSSQFGFDEKSMAGKAVKAVRWIYAITGVLALVSPASHCCLRLPSPSSS